MWRDPRQSPSPAPDLHAFSRPAPRMWQRNPIKEDSTGEIAKWFETISQNLFFFFRVKEVTPWGWDFYPKVRNLLWVMKDMKKHWDSNTLSLTQHNQCSFNHLHTHRTSKGLAQSSQQELTAESTFVKGLTLWYTWNSHSTVNQLSFNNKTFFKSLRHRKLFLSLTRDYWFDHQSFHLGKSSIKSWHSTSRISQSY